MTLEFAKTFSHRCGTKAQKEYSETELKEILLNLMRKNGVDTDKIEAQQDGMLTIKESPNLNLHTIMLEAEKLGLETRYTKRTQIEICC